MTLTEILTATAAYPPALITAAATVTGGVIIGAAWRMMEPAGTRGDIPALTSPAGKPDGPALREAAVAPLEIPLDVIPRDERGRTPYDLVGPDEIRTAVDQFYSRVCGDGELKDFFADVDIRELKRHQAQFISQLWGGPTVYALDELAAAHQRLKISPERYWRVCGHLMVTLTHLSIADWICVFTMTRLYQARDLIAAREPVE
jgi:hemoglobin